MPEPYNLPSDAQIGSVSLKVSSLERAEAFYADLLGFRVLERREEGIDLSAGDGAAPVLRLTEIPGATPKPPRTTGLYHVAIRLPDKASLGALLRRLIERRYPLQGAADHLVSEAIYLADPDHNGLELYIDRPRDEWPRIGDQVQMASDPLDAQALLDAAGDGVWQGIAAGTDIGHVHLQVSDLKAAEAFYCGMIGFQVTQRSYPGALFVSAGGYHHHIGLNIWAGRGAPPPPPEAVGLESFRIAIPDETARTSLLEHLTAQSVPLEHTEDGSVLVTDPDGIRVSF